jgi:hypothetical protein
MYHCILKASIDREKCNAKQMSWDSYNFSTTNHQVLEEKLYRLNSRLQQIFVAMALGKHCLKKCKISIMTSNSYLQL